MSVQVITWVLEHEAVTSGGTRLTLIALANRADPDTGECFPSHERLAREAHVSVRQTKRCLDELRALGLVDWTTRGQGGGGTNVYQLVGYLEWKGAIVSPFKGDAGDDRRGTSATKKGDTGGLRTVSEPSVETSEELSVAFDAFWSAYPRKVGKLDAGVRFERAVKRGTPAAVIVAGAERYRDDPNRVDTFTAHPSTWLNQGRWEDDPLPTRNGHRDASGDDPVWAAARARAAAAEGR